MCNGNETESEGNSLRVLLLSLVNFLSSATGPPSLLPDALLVGTVAAAGEGADAKISGKTTTPPPPPPPRPGLPLPAQPPSEGSGAKVPGTHSPSLLGPS